MQHVPTCACVLLTRSHGDRPEVRVTDRLLHVLFTLLYHVCVFYLSLTSYASIVSSNYSTFD